MAQSEPQGVETQGVASPIRTGAPSLHAPAALCPGCAAGLKPPPAPLISRSGPNADVALLEWLMVGVGRRVRLVRADDVDWIGAEGNYMRLHRGSESFLIREKIGVLEAQLDPKRFLRIHRSTIVNISRIKELHPWSKGDFIVVLRCGTELKLSRGYAVRLGPHLRRYG